MIVERRAFAWGTTVLITEFIKFVINYLSDPSLSGSLGTAVVARNTYMAGGVNKG